MEERKTMQKTDLMIGNYIRDIWSEDGFFKVTELRKDKVLYGNCLKAQYKNVRPIPLTEEILLKCGAKKIEDDHVYLMLNDASTHLILMKVGEYWYPSIEQEAEFSMLDSNIISLERIDSVHELQNLYKVLTKNELDIKI